MELSFGEHVVLISSVGLCTITDAKCNELELNCDSTTSYGNVVRYFSMTGAWYHSLYRAPPVYFLLGAEIEIKYVVQMYCTGTYEAPIRL